MTQAQTGMITERINRLLFVNYLHRIKPVFKASCFYPEHNIYIFMKKGSVQNHSCTWVCTVFTVL